MRRDQECPLCRIPPVQRHVEIAGDIGRYGKARQAAGLRDQIMRELLALAVRCARNPDRVVGLLRERVEQSSRQLKVRLRDGALHLKPAATRV
jgi:putative hemolysin